MYQPSSIPEDQAHTYATCCRRCQKFADPEKYCMDKAITCDKCGDDGHNHDECQVSVTRCATCRKFGRKEAGAHKMNARDCSAR